MELFCEEDHAFQPTGLVFWFGLSRQDQVEKLGSSTVEMTVCSYDSGIFDFFKEFVTKINVLSLNNVG